MTFTEIVNEVAERLNLTTPTALTRIGRTVNERHREVASSIGMQVLSYTTMTANTVVASQLVTFTGVQKLYTVWNPGVPVPVPIGEVSLGEMRLMLPTSDPPTFYAIENMAATSVTIKINCIPASIYAIGADVLVNTGALSGTMTPIWSENFHNILIYGAMATELEKMEKYPLAAKQNAMFEKRVSEMRLFIAISAWKDVFQSKLAAPNMLVVH